MNNCSYCGSEARPGWIVCGEGKTWGCGAPILRPIIEPPPATMTIRNSVTRPGIPASEFDKMQHIETWASAVRRLEKDAENMQIEIGRAFIEAFAGPVVKIAGWFAR